MAAAEITPKYYNKQGAQLVVGRFTKVTQADWIVLPYPGVQNIKANLYTGADEITLTYGTVLIDNSSTAYSATTTTLVIKTGAITRQAPYYLQTTSGEIIYVMTDSAKGSAGATLTVIRGCLGTTASLTGLADGNTLYIKNMVVFGSASTGVVDFAFFPMSWEPKALEFT